LRGASASCLRADAKAATGDAGEDLVFLLSQQVVVVCWGHFGTFAVKQSMKPGTSMSAQENEGEAVRTTIVGGRPTGSGRGTGTIPRGVEVLLKKAAVDAEFRQLLCEERVRAAEVIGLELDAAERAMLKSIPREQLESIITQTLVPVEQRRVFLGRMAAPMLALLGVAVTGCQEGPPSLGIQPARPVSAGIRPRAPGTNEPPAQASPTTPSTNRPASPVSDGIRPDRP